VQFVIVFEATLVIPSQQWVLDIAMAPFDFILGGWRAVRNGFLPGQLDSGEIEDPDRGPRND